MKNPLIIITVLAFQSCCIVARDSGPVLLDAADRALNPYHLGDSFQMKDSKTGNEYWFKVKLRAMSAATMLNFHKECESQLHTQKEETLLEADSSEMNLLMTFTKGNLKLASEFDISNHGFNLANPTLIDSMTLAGQRYYQVHKGRNRLADGSTQPATKRLWVIFYTPKDGIIQGVYSDSSTLDLVK